MPARQTRLANAVGRAERDARIFSLMQLGWSYDAIAEREGLSRERVRQIVNAALDRRGGEPSAEHRRLQLARLDPALRLAAEKVAEGDLRAVDKLIRVIGQMDKYRPPARGPAGPRFGFIGESQESDDEARERILRKLSGDDDPDEETAQDEGWDAEEDARERILQKLAEVDARRAAYAAEAAEEAAKAAAEGRPDAPPDDSVSKFFAR